MESTKRLIAGLVFFSAIGIAPPAHAYLDPGTGSMLLQLLLGGVAGALVVGKLYWHRVKAFFGRESAPDPSQDPAVDSDGE